MHTLGYRVPPLDGEARRSPTAGRSCATSARPRPSTASTSTSATAPGWCAADVVKRRRPLDGHRRADADRRALAADLRVPLSVHRLLPLRPGLHAAVARRRRLRRPDRASAAVAGGPGRHRPSGSSSSAAARPRSTLVPALARDGRAGHHAAALADATSCRCPPTTRSRPAAQGTARAAGARGHPLEEHPDVDGGLPAVPEVPGADAEGAPRRGRQAAARRLRRGHALQAALRPVGPADVHGAGRRLLRRHPVREGRRRHRSRSRRSPSPACGSAPARASRPT